MLNTGKKAHAFIRCLGAEMKKNNSFPFFAVSVSLFVCICFLGDCVTGQNGQHYQVYDIMLLSKYLPLTKDLRYSWMNVWEAGLGPWTILAAPMLMTAGFVFINTKEKTENADRYLLFREGRLFFALSKTVSAMLSAGLVCTIGYIIYGIILMPFFPSASEYSAENAELIGSLYGSSICKYITFRLVGAFLFGVSVSLLPIILSAFVSDMYILISMPFLGIYIYETIFKRISVSKWGEEHIELLNALDFGQLPYFGVNRKKFITLTLLAAACMICIISYYFIRFREERR